MLYNVRRAAGRLGYYLRRFREAPLNITVVKVQIGLRRLIYWPSYLIGAKAGGQGRPRHVNVEALKRLGADLRERLYAEAIKSPGYRQRAMSRAESTYQGLFPCLGFGELPIPKGTQWHADPIHGYVWPNVYFARCDYVQRQRCCDVKIPWELSRFQYMLWLAEGFVLAEDEQREKYVVRFLEIIDDWISHNPAGYGVNWTCAMEAGIRLCNMGLATALFSSHLSDSKTHVLAKVLEQHYLYIKRFPEISDVPGNHYLANLLGLLVFELQFSKLRAADTSSITEAFVAEADRQFEQEGGHVERAPIYHRLCLDMVALGAAVIARHTKDVPARLVHVLGRGLAYCRCVGTPGGILPIFGDSDSGHVLWFGQCARSFKSVSQFFSSLTGNVLSQPPADFAIWLAALAEKSTMSPRGSAGVGAQQRILSLEHRSGFIALSAGAVKVVMRVGAQGLQGRAPHDHDDSLSLWGFLGDADLIVEEACHSYTLSADIRRHNLSSAAHNVVQRRDAPRYIARDGSVMATSRGAPVARIEQLTRCEASVMAKAVIQEEERSLAGATGVQESSRSVRLVRECEIVRLEITDEWLVAEASPMSICWHMPPDIHLQEAGESGTWHLSRANARNIARLSIGRVDGGAIIGVAHSYGFCGTYGRETPAECVIGVCAASHKGAIVSNWIITDSTPDVGSQGIT